MILLENVDTSFGTIKIIESKKDGTITYYQGECFQSQVDARGTSTCAYIHVMYKIMMAVQPKRVLVIGGAGGTLATLLHRAGCRVTLVDINDYAFVLARRYFQLPDGIECITADGATWLEENDAPFDAIAVDAFNGKGIIPIAMRKTEFFRYAKEAIGKKGAIVMNVMTAHDLDRESDRIAQKMHQAGLATVLYDWPGTQDRNTLVTGGAAPLLELPEATDPDWLKKELKGITCRASLV